MGLCGAVAIHLPCDGNICGSNPCVCLTDSVAEWLRRWIANPLLFERKSSNLFTVDFFRLFTKTVPTVQGASIRKICYLIMMNNRGCSSVAERPLCMRKVAGSIPVSSSTEESRKKKKNV